MKTLLIIITFLLSFNAHASPPVNVSMYGDSTTNNECTRLDAAYGVNVIFSCNGVGGTTFKDLIKGENGQIKFIDDMATSNAHIVMINFGINDAFQGYPAVGWYMGEIKRIAKLHGKTLIFQTSNPINNPYYQANSDMANNVRYWAGVNNVHLVDNYLNIHNTPNWTSMLPDGVHPNAQLYQIKANYTNQKLLPLVQWHLNN